MPRDSLSVPKVVDKTVTDTLARAMENADRMKNVIVLYETHDDADAPGGFFASEESTIALINYLLDLGKHWIFNS